MSSKHDTTASGEAANGASDGPALVPDDSADVQSGHRLRRRTFLKGIGASVAGGAALSLNDGPVGDAEAVLPVLAAGAIAGTAAGIAFGATFFGPDSEAVADSLAWQDHVDEFTRAREDRLNLDQLIPSLKRDIALVENKAREQAIYNIYEQGVDSGSQADATAAAEAAINEAYATVEKSIINSFTQRYLRSRNVFAGLGGTLGSDFVNDITGVREGTEDGSTTGGEISFQYEATNDYTLLNGNRLTYNGIVTNRTNGGYALLDPVEWTEHHSEAGPHYTQIYIEKPDTANYGSVDSSDALEIEDSEALLIDGAVWGSLLEDLYAEHSTMMGEVSTMVDAYYQPAADGEIDLFEAVGPQHLTDTASTAKDYQEASMALRAMGFPLSKQVVTIELPDANSDGTIELTGRLSWTAHQGNELSVGGSLNAGNVPGSIFAAVNLPDNTRDLLNSTSTNQTYTESETGPGAQIVELTDEFTIVSAGGADGVTFEDRSLASSTMTNEEIKQIYKENYTANKEATETVHDAATGGGGGSSGMGTTGKALIVGALGAAGIGILNN